MTNPADKALEEEKASLAKELKEENAMPKLAETEGNLIVQTIKQDEKTGLLHVSVVPPKEGPRRPTVVVCLIDVSGSMGNTATDANTGESDGFSILDLVKHSLKTIIHAADEADYLALIEFESKTTTLLPVCQMNEEGRKKALDIVGNMCPKGSTNLEAGMVTSLNLIISDPICAKANTSLWVFTDGQPDNASIVIPAMKKVLNGSSPPCVINTFGFGYSLDSELLYQMAELGNGLFGFVPDCNLLGTTFVNCLSNTMATAMYKCYLRVNAENASNLKCIGYDVKDGKIELGTVQYGQQRDILFSFDMLADKTPKFQVQLKSQLGIIKKDQVGLQADDPISLYRGLCRCKYSEIIRPGLLKCVSGKIDLKFLTEIIDLIKSNPSKDDECTKALLKDLESPNEMEGRVSKALSTTERINRWGKHYILAILRAHKLQQSHNFKDPGVQVYGGKMFKEFQLKADKTFCALPPPIPSNAPIKKSPADPNAPPPPVNMNNYMDSSGGCFDGNSLTKLADGSMKCVKDLRKGDLIMSMSGKVSKVVCLIEIPMNKVMNMVNFNGLLLTPKHPVFYNGEWTYPQSVFAPILQYVNSVYNLVLDENHTIQLNGTYCVTLGHMKYDNKIVQHEYYGSKRAIEDVQRISGYETGKIIMTCCKKYKDPFTGKTVCIN